MTEVNSNVKQGPFAGSKCLAGPAGHWSPATVRRVNEDGTFKIEFDVKQLKVLPFWFGVTLAEISFDDRERWPAVFEQLSPDRTELSKADFRKAIGLFYVPSDQQFQKFWIDNCQKLFKIEEKRAETLSLDRDSAYTLFLHLGLCAKQLEERFRVGKASRHASYYWNQIRMGGREPSEIPRPVLLDDAFAAIGLCKNSVDEAKATLLRKVEMEQSVCLPLNLKNFLSRNGVGDAVSECHSNNPGVIYPGDDEWSFRRDINHQALKAKYAIPILGLYGDSEWMAVFDDGEEDARVFMRWDKGNGEGEEWTLTSPTIGMFFWDLAQTGLGWYQDTKFRGGKRVKRTDIGLILA